MIVFYRAIVGWIFIVAVYHGGDTTLADEPRIIQVLDYSEITAKEILDRVIESNQVWLAPSVENLSYTLRMSRIDGKKSVEALLTHVWVSDRSIRSEIEKNGERQHHLRGLESDGKNVMVHTPASPEDVAAFSRGFQWSSAFQTLQRYGGNENVDAKLLTAPTAKNKYNAVIAIDFREAPMHVGLGLSGTYYGRVNQHLGKVHLHIKLPEYIPVKEEYLDSGSFIQYRDFFKTNDSYAPRTIQYVDSRLNHEFKWCMRFRFQVKDQTWLLDRAWNLHSGQAYGTIRVTDISFEPIDPSRFGLAQPLHRLP